MRFGLELIEAVRREVGSDYVVGIRMSGDEMLEGGLSHEDCIEIARIHAEHGGIDFISVVGGQATDYKASGTIWPTMWLPSAPFLHLASAIRAAVDVPVFHATAGHGRRDRGARRGRGARRHDRNDPRLHRRSALREQARPRRGGGDPALRGRRLLRGPGALRPGRAVRAEPRHRPRGEASADHLAVGGPAPAGGGGGAAAREGWRRHG